MFDGSGSVGYTEDSTKIWQDRVVVAVMTGFNERIMRPTFGSDVAQAASENINDALSAIKQGITLAFSRWLPELTFMGLQGFIDPYDGYLVIQITYNYRAQNSTRTVNIKTAVLSRSGDIIREVAKND